MIFSVAGADKNARKVDFCFDDVGKNWSFDFKFEDLKAR